MSQANAQRTSDTAVDLVTEVELIGIEKKIEHWIRFGRTASEQIASRRTRILAFRPNSIFAFVR
jgi:hypothetical protein